MSKPQLDIRQSKIGRDPSHLAFAPRLSYLQPNSISFLPRPVSQNAFHAECLRFCNEQDVRRNARDAKAGQLYGEMISIRDAAQEMKT